MYSILIDQPSEEYIAMSFTSTVLEHVGQRLLLLIEIVAGLIQESLFRPSTSVDALERVACINEVIPSVDANVNAYAATDCRCE